MMNNYIENYKTYISSKNLKVNTVNSYIYDMNSFKAYMENDYGIDLTKTKKAHILTYLVSLQKNGKSSSTISRTISTLKNFYEYMKREKLVDDNPAVSIHSPKQIKKSPSFLTEKEINILMDMPDKKAFKGARDSAILELMYSSGIKVSELISIKTADVNTNLNIINIIGTRERIVPLNNISREALILYLESFRNKKSKEDNQYLFINISGEPISRQGIWKILKYYEEKMNISKELSPQILRNSFAVHLLSHGADLGSVQELMGLSSLAATQNYLQSLEFKSLDVFRKTFPRG